MSTSCGKSNSKIIIWLSCIFPKSYSRVSAHASQLYYHAPTISKNSRHVGFSSHALRPRCKLLLYFYGFCNYYYSIYFLILCSVYFQLCYVSFIMYLVCVISYLRMLLIPGCTSNNSNTECVCEMQHIWLLYTYWDSLQWKLSLKMINRTNSDWSNSFYHKWEVIARPNRPQAKFFTSGNNRIGFPAFGGAAARQNEWKWILATFAAFLEKM